MRSVSKRPSAPRKLVVGVVLTVAAIGVFSISPPATSNEAESDGGRGGGPVRVEAEVPVTAMDQSRKPANNSPQIAAHPDGGMLALASRVDAPDFSCALHLSGDGGSSWVPTDPVPQLPEGAEKCYGPQVAFGSDGTLYYLFAGLSGEGNTPMGVFLTVSHDRGQTFSEPRRILGEFNFAASMAIDRTRGESDRLYFTWVEARSEVGTGSFGPAPNPVMGAYSDDGGQSLSEPVRVSDADRERVVAPTIDVDGDGRVHIAYYDLLEDHRDYQGLEGPTWDGQWELVWTSSEDGGELFSDGEVVAEVRPHERIMVIFTAAPPALSTGQNGQVCVGWTGARHGSADVFARCRSSTREEWHEPVRLNDDPLDAEATQELPQLAIAPNGRVDAVFYDRRRGPGDDYTDVFYATSSDGGQTFEKNGRITSQYSFRLLGQQYPLLPSAEGMVEFGNRLGLHAGNDAAVAAWADTRNSRPPSTAQDVFAAVLTDFPQGTSGSGIPAGWLAGAVAAVAGGALLAVIGRRQRPSSRAEGDSAISEARS